MPLEPQAMIAQKQRPVYAHALGVLILRKKQGNLYAE